jgi:O-acetyl-ADP-ribose deacetylase (regulator of RNase III)
MPLTVVRQDVTTLKVDAIVNAANTSLMRGHGVCAAIFKAAGPRELKAVCRKLAPVKTGEAVITPGFNLPAKYIIHAVGPIYRRHTPENAEELLRSAYINALNRAVEVGCKSIAFPLIASGAYKFPKGAALRIAVCAIRDFVAQNDIDVTLALFDDAAYKISLAEKLWR